MGARQSSEAQTSAQLPARQLTRALWENRDGGAPSGGLLVHGMPLTAFQDLLQNPAWDQLVTLNDVSPTSSAWTYIRTDLIPYVYGPLVDTRPLEAVWIYFLVSAPVMWPAVTHMIVSDGATEYARGQAHGDGLIEDFDCEGNADLQSGGGLPRMLPFEVKGQLLAESFTALPNGKYQALPSMCASYRCSSCPCVANSWLPTYTGTQWETCVGPGGRDFKTVFASSYESSTVWPCRFESTDFAAWLQGMKSLRSALVEPQNSMENEVDVYCSNTEQNPFSESLLGLAISVTAPSIYTPRVPPVPWEVQQQKEREALQAIQEYARRWAHHPLALFAANFAPSTSFSPCVEAHTKLGVPFDAVFQALPS